jgi:MoxR-like ATPase
LTHRLILRPESRLRKLTPATVVADVVAEVPVPILNEGRDPSLPLPYEE